MQLQLGHVLAGLAMGRGKPQDERLVDDLMGGRIADAGERGFSRLGDFPDEDFQRFAGARAGDADHGNRRRPAAGGKGEDGGAVRGHPRMV